MASRTKSPRGALRSEAQDEHLDPECRRSQRDQARSRIVSDFERNLVVTDADIDEMPFQ